MQDAHVERRVPWLAPMGYIVQSVHRTFLAQSARDVPNSMVSLVSTPICARTCDTYLWPIGDRLAPAARRASVAYIGTSSLPISAESRARSADTYARSSSSRP